MGRAEAAGAQVRRHVGRHGAGRCAAALAIVARGRRASGRSVVVVSALAGVTDALEAALRGRCRRPARRRRLRRRRSRERHRAAPARAWRSGGRPRGAAAAAGAARRARGPPPSPSPRSGAALPPTARPCWPLGERLSAPVFAGGPARRSASTRARSTPATLVRTDAAFAEATVDLAGDARALVRGALADVPSGRGAGRDRLHRRDRDGRDDPPRSRRLGLSRPRVLGWALDAERVEIWSDVDGVMTADPRRRARRPARSRGSSYAEATALARGGAKVLHPRTLEPLERGGIPVFVGNTLAARTAPAPGSGPRTCSRDRGRGRTAAAA